MFRYSFAPVIGLALLILCPSLFAKVQAHPSLKTLNVLTYNLGNARLFQKPCPQFKLCDAEHVARLKNWFHVVQPDVALLQEVGQEAAHAGIGDLFDRSLYDFSCRDHLCVVWRRALFDRDLNCSDLTLVTSGFLKCEAQVDGFSFQLVSIYYPNMRLPSRTQRLKRLDRLRLARALFYGEEGLVDPHRPLLIGGDFNTRQLTHVMDGRFPYPSQFYTLFGRHQVNHGSRPSPLSFFGYWGPQGPMKVFTHGAYGLRNQFDHVFANFGWPQSDDHSTHCRHGVCIMGEGEWGARFKDHHFFGTDHRAIWTRLEFQAQQSSPLW